ncbi:thioredoxin family protein [Chitinophaga ginsengisegetis]|uniref:TlpA family protein disulfide reductase n=1 Tax=Chitinophaga ginsengisegetis TaxID=393003 RepID=UPI003423F454
MTRKEIFIYGSTLTVGLLLYIGASSIIGLNSFNKQNKLIFTPPESTGKEGASIPSFTILLPDSSTNVKIDSFYAGKQTVLIYFSPYCPYCQAEINEIIANINRLKNINFCFLTPYSFTEMKNFYDHYKLNKYSNIQVGIDNHYFFGKYFNTVKTPFIAIYDKDKKLNAAFVGVVSSDQIIAVFKD